MRRDVPVLKAVAYHPTMLFVPTELAILNVIAWTVVFLVLVVTHWLSPLFAFIAMATCHILLAIDATREIHRVTILRALAKTPLRRSRNIIPTTGGVKYVP